ncbi:MAG: methyltransferase, TIGR04325 family [Opitutaceae bacterium]|nr:methyltransferase, TIGR04325 family [Opitutaceae bacterium]
MKAALRQLIPRPLRRAVRRLVRPPIYRGDFATWAEAQRAARGYAEPAIAEKVIAAARAVRDGRAAWERDTILFAEPAANAPLLRALRRAAAAHGGRLRVADFGGALGSTWWQHRLWLADLAEVSWAVIEQPALVEAGRREFTTGPLQFFFSLDECAAATPPDVLLLSSVLPYLENPRALLAAAAARPFRHAIIDRTGFVARGRDRLTVQHVPPAIYDASYPCWFFDRASLFAAFAPGWRIAEEWVTDDEADIDAEHRGVHFERNAP